MYSLILSDEIVAAIDRMAALQGTSRSALVNHLLAEHTALPTPEKQARDIFAVVEELMGQQLRSSFSPGGALTLHTAVQYKYNPQLNYTLELTPGQPALGRLRVGLRSQNQALLAYMQLFFQLWARLEQTHLPAPPQAGQQQLEAKRYSRTLRRPALLHNDRQAGEAIAAYVAAMDSCLHTYFDNLSDAEEAVAATETDYLSWLPRLGPAAEF